MNNDCIQSTGRRMQLFTPNPPPAELRESSLKLKCDDVTNSSISIMLLLRRTLVLHQFYATHTLKQLQKAILTFDF